MLIYEKENKLNINFDNEVSENPDLQISKEDGKTSVMIDGEPSGGGSSGGGALVVTFTYDGGHVISDKTMKEILDASKTGVVVACGHNYTYDYSGPISIDYDNESKNITLYRSSNSVYIFSVGSDYVYGSYTDDGTQWTVPD